MALVHISEQVSTLSRPKAAAIADSKTWIGMDRHGGFNTQPPEGGWAVVWPHMR